MTPAALEELFAAYAGSSPGDEVQALAERIYRSHHCRVREPVAPAQSRAVSTWSAHRAFVDDLSRANTGAGPWHPGWIVQGTGPDGSIEVAQGGLHLWARPADVRGVAVHGAEVRVHFPYEYRLLTPGYYVALGDADTGVRAPQVRMYWNLHGDGAVPLVGLVTSTLNAAGLGFRLKVLSDRRDYVRTDAGVLYLPLAEFDAAFHALQSVHARMREHLHEDVSAFVHRVAPGVGVAEDPPGGESFGMHRGRIVAQCLMTSATSPADAMRAAGHDPDAPYRNPGSLRAFGHW